MKRLLGMVPLLAAALCACSAPEAAPTTNGPAMQQAESPPQRPAQSPWASKLGQTVTVEGQASNAKLGAIVGAEPAPIWIDGIDAWPEEVAWKRVQVTGTVIDRHDLPVFVQDKGEPEMSGIPVPPGTDLHEASRRFLLKGARWKRVD